MSALLKIAVLGTRGFPGVQGGVEKHCEELYPRLVELGCNVKVFTRTPYIKEENRVANWKGVDFIHLGSPRIKALEAIIHTFRGVLMARVLSPDILHIHSIGPSLMVPLAKLFRMKVVVTHHGPDYERDKWGSIAKFFLRLGERLGVRYADRVIAISIGIKEHVRLKFARDVEFIPNGVGAAFKVSAGAELEKWGLTSGKYIFTACRFVPEKGLHDLIEAYLKIKEPPFKLVIAGGADHESDYSRRLKRAAKENDAIVLTGFVYNESLAELYTNTALFVLPSYYEGLPIALLEALSYGLPLLVSDIPQHKDVELRSARYFKKGNVDELTTALVDSFSAGISDDEKQEYLSLVKEKYDWGMIAKETLKLYGEILL